MGPRQRAGETNRTGHTATQPNLIIPEQVVGYARTRRDRGNRSDGHDGAEHRPRRARKALRDYRQLTRRGHVRVSAERSVLDIMAGV